MICRLTHAQFQAITTRMPELYATAMREHRTTWGRTQHDYDMPAIAWRQILDRMTEVCFGPAGGKLKGPGRPSDSAYVAIAKVANVVRQAEGHPALHGRMVEGFVGDVVPAWKWQTVCATLFSPYPGNPCADFVLLVPQHEENLGMKVTRWEPSGIPWHYAQGRSWTFQSESHLLFTRSRAGF